MRKLIMSLTATFLLMLACSTSSPEGIPGRRDPQSNSQSQTEVPSISPIYTGLNSGELEAYMATYDLNFTGSYDWAYDLITRSDGELIEYSLHIEGVDPSQNLGDLRLVTDGETSRMSGPGTDNECFLFPSDFELISAFQNPDDLLSPQIVNEILTLFGEGTIGGFESVHYTAEQSRVGIWQEVQIDIWLNHTETAALRYLFTATGVDPLFDAGEGQISASFRVTEISAQDIEPIPGCEIGLPIPESASRLVRFPGLVSFESAATAEEVIAFYQEALVVEGWQEVTEPQIGEDAILLTYSKGDELLDINIEISSSGVSVDLIMH
ncbi:MAG: hypothetical protein FVQ83_03740 [Chloroflexi bacterium]|nr:hypothetical protein [Chloroflexota bacterium]